LATSDPTSAGSVAGAAATHNKALAQAMKILLII
jgi:hypothetical protein